MSSIRRKCRCGGGVIKWLCRGGKRRVRMECGKCGRFFGYEVMTKKELIEWREARDMGRQRAAVKREKEKEADRARPDEETLTFKAFGKRPRYRRRPR